MPAARNGIDIIRKPAIVAVSVLTASMPAIPAIVIKNLRLNGRSLSLKLRIFRKCGDKLRILRNIFVYRSSDNVLDLFNRFLSEGFNGKELKNALLALRREFACFNLCAVCLDSSVHIG